MWVIRCSIVEWDCSKTQTLLETLKILNQRRKILCIFGSRTFVHISWMYKKTNLSITHSSTESDVVSLDAGLRMGGISELDLWDLVTDVLHDANDVPARGNTLRDEIHGKHTSTNSKTKNHGNRGDVDLSDVDHVITNAKPSHFEAMLYTVEDNEAVIKRIIIGRSPTMRHVSASTAASNVRIGCERADNGAEVRAHPVAPSRSATRAHPAARLRTPPVPMRQRRNLRAQTFVSLRVPTAPTLQ